MKRFLALLLALILCLGIFAGCEKAPAPEVWEQTVFSFAENPDSYKPYGRIGQSEQGAEIIWAASGMEFTLKCSGDVTLNYNAATPGYFHLTVDGGEPTRPRFRTGLKSITLAEGLAEGEHTFRIIHENDINGGGGSVFFKELEFYGVKTSVKPVPNDALYIEFIGDSITSGRGVLAQGGGYDTVDECHSPVNGYAVRTAELLEADWSLVSKGGCGYYRTDVGCAKPAREMYPYLHPFGLHLTEYVPTRQADIIVLALGHNDDPKLYSEAQIRAACLEMIEMARAKHGEDTPVVLLTGMMSENRWHTLFPQICEELPGVFFTSVPKNWDGGLNHPDVDASIETADILAALIRDEVLPTLQK